MQGRVVLVAQRGKQFGVIALAGGVQPGVVCQRAIDADVAKIDVEIARTCRIERRQEELQHLAVGRDGSMPIELAADLDHFACHAGSGGHGPQHTAGIAKARDARFVEEMRVHARHLGRGIRAHAEHAAGQRVDGLEGLQIEIAPGSGEQRVEIFDQRRHDETIAAYPKVIEQRATQRFDARGLGWQHILDRFGQDPLTHS